MTNEAATAVGRELLKGSLDVMLLALLQHEALYGYQIVKEVRGRSNGVLQMREGTLYPALHRLERAGLVESFWQQRPDGADRRYYRLTVAGAQAARAKRDEYWRFAAAVEGVLGYGS